MKFKKPNKPTLRSGEKELQYFSDIVDRSIIVLHHDCGDYYSLQHHRTSNYLFFYYFPDQFTEYPTLHTLLSNITYSPYNPRFITD